MKKFLTGMVATALAGGLAFAQQETTQEEVTEYGEEVGQEAEQEAEQQMDEWDSTRTEPEDPTQAQTEDPTTDEPAAWGEEESGMQHTVADMSAEELKGLTVVTETGEEVGQIDRVGTSEEHQDRVATVDVGGFLGVAEKTIAIPLSELEMTSDGNVQTMLTKESIESYQEFDEQGFTEEGEESTGY